MVSRRVLAAWLALGFALAGPLCASASDTEIAVLLADRVGRDADLEPKPLQAEELERLRRAAGVSLRPLGLQSHGAQVLALSGAPDGARLRALLAGLRRDPEVLYADRITRSTPLAPPPGATLDRIVVKLADPVSRDDSDAARSMPQETVRRLSRVAGVPLFHERPVSGGAYSLRLFQKMSDEGVAGIVARLEADPAVSYAEPSVRGRFGAWPNDELYAEQWPLGQGPGGIDAAGAWERTRGSSQVVVAVLDSGIRPEHPDLRGRLLPGYDFVSDVRRSNDFDPRDPDPTDPGDATLAAECAIGSAATVATWHGTHVAGTLGAATNNRRGMAGVDWKARILPVRVGANCGIDPIDLVDAIRWASGSVGEGRRLVGVSSPVTTPARVLNLSMEFPGACPRFLQEAIDDAIAAGALVVVAAGNGSRPAADFHPANCQGVLAVHATDVLGARASYSNYGDVDISAPGGNMAMEQAGGVLSTVVAGDKRAGSPDYGFKEGTSMATPMVAGVAALLLSLDPALRPGELHNILEATARPFPVGTGADCSDTGERSCGAGILDAAAAVRAVDAGA